MAREAITPAQKLLNRYVFSGAAFTGLAALVLARFAWVRLAQGLRKAPAGSLPQTRLCTLMHASR
jgi:hypothetical protein